MTGVGFLVLFSIRNQGVKTLLKVITKQTRAKGERLLNLREMLARGVPGAPKHCWGLQRHLVHGDSSGLFVSKENRATSTQSVLLL